MGESVKKYQRDFRINDGYEIIFFVKKIKPIFRFIKTLFIFVSCITGLLLTKIIQMLYLILNTLTNKM